MDRRRLLGLSLTWPLLAPPPVLALAPPESTPVLTVTGKLRRPNVQAAAVFDMAMLERLPQTSFSTLTPWYAQPRKFTGPLLREVLAVAGVRGSLVRAVALNDYRVDIPIDDVQRYDVLLARLLDDKPMPVRERGPLVIVYPFDDKLEVRNAVHYSRAVWQLRSLDLR